MPTNNKEKTISASSEPISPPSDLPSHVNKKLLIDVDNLTTVLGAETVLDHLSFCIHQGEFIGLIGPNGAGKTTLLKTLLGLVRPTSGSVNKKIKTVGYIPQRGFMHDAQLPLSVLEVVRLGSFGKSAAARHALEEVQMWELASKRFTSLSGGQQQRVLIAKALASNPEILILDEPTTGIDEASQIEFYKTLNHLKERGMAVLMVSHDIDIVLRQVDRVICLNHTILYDGQAEHFEPDQYLPAFYAAEHRRLHHQHGGSHA